jgi:hypothetical protein
MSTEQKEHSQLTCHWCGHIWPRNEIRFVDDKAICMKGTCREEYYESTRPKSLPRGTGFANPGQPAAHANELGAGDSYDWLHGGHGD